jgi:hypothetical protein
MRLPSVERPQTLSDRLLFGMIRITSGYRTVDVIRTLRYRPALFGTPMGAVFQTVLRGDSEWTVGERELFAAWVSRNNECEF